MSGGTPTKLLLPSVGRNVVMDSKDEFTFTFSSWLVPAVFGILTTASSEINYTFYTFLWNALNVWIIHDSGVSNDKYRFAQRRHTHHRHIYTEAAPSPPSLCTCEYCAGILEQSMGARNRVGTELSSRHASLCSLAYFSETLFLLTS